MRPRHPGEWDGIGIALPGIIDEERGRVLSCNDKHAGVENVDIFAWARERLSLPCRVINDARAALYGELNFGCAKGEQNAVMMILGTGVGTSAVCRGHVERGVHGTAGLLGGHFPIQFDGGRKCNCGGEGCLEAYVGTWALKEMAGDADYDYRRFAEDYAKGNEKARRLFATVSTALGAGALALVHLYDAETVIWSGGASHFAAFALIGIGNTILQAALPALLGNVTPPALLASRISFGQFVKAICAALTPVFIYVAASVMGNWRLVFPIYGVLAAATAAWLMLSRIPDEREAIRSRGTRDPTVMRTTFGSCFALLRDPLVLALDKLPDKANEITALMVMAIAGGAVVPPVLGFAQKCAGSTGLVWVLLACLAYQAVLSVCMYNKE